MEKALAQLQNRDQASRDFVEEARLLRRLDWAYNEVRYVQPNRSVNTNPRSPDIIAKSPDNVRLSLASLPDEKREVAQKLIDGFAAAGYSPIHQAAALANAIAESNLNPKAVGDQGLAKGLFLSHPARCVKYNGCEDTDDSIREIINEENRVPVFRDAQTLSDAVRIFTQQIVRPFNSEAQWGTRLQIAQRFVQIQ